MNKIMSDNSLKKSKQFQYLCKCIKKKIKQCSNLVLYKIQNGNWWYQLIYVMQVKVLAFLLKITHLGSYYPPLFYFK